MMQVEYDLLWHIIRRANTLGKEGYRVIGFDYIKAEAADKTDTYKFIIDNGPQSATESW